MLRRICLGLCVLTLAATGAWAGTATIGFASGLGPLDNGLSSRLSTSGGKACFSGADTALLGSGSPVNASGTASIQITLQPSSANPTIGLTLVGNAGTNVRAYTDAAGTVTIENDLGDSNTTFFSFPAASNNYMRLEYSTSTDTATVFVPGGSGGERSASIQGIALDGATGFNLGVFASGSACFDDLVAIGASIPNYSDPTATVIKFKLSGAQQVPANGSIATGCGTATLSLDQTTLTIHIEHGVYQPTMAHIHLGAAGVNGGVIIPFADMTSPIDEQFTITGQNATDLLAGNFYANIHSDAFPGGEIRGQIVNDNSACSVTVDPGPADTDHDGVFDDDDAFPHNPYGQTDSDNDGIGDEWEIDHFGGLGIVNDLSDFDNDGVSDVVEFENAVLGFDPQDGDSQLPVLGGAGLAAMSAALVLVGRRRR